jgi:hypothetical protein
LEAFGATKLDEVFSAISCVRCLYETDVSGAISVLIWYQLPDYEDRDGPRNVVFIPTPDAADSLRRLHWTDDRGFNPGRGNYEIFSLPYRLRGPPSLLSNEYGGLTQGVKRLGREADH